MGIFVSNSFSKLKKEDVVEAETFEYMHISFESWGRSLSLFLLLFTDHLIQEWVGS